MKALVFGDEFSPRQLTDFEVVREPQGDVVAVLTVPERPVDEELISRLPALRVIGTASAGYDHVDLEAAARRGIAVVSVPDYCIAEMADHTLALVYALLRGVVVLDRLVSAGEWDAKGAGALGTMDEQRVGIVGLGRVGRAVAARLVALGAEVWAHDIAPEPGSGVPLVELGELLAECDVVTMHVPLTPETRGLIGKSQLASMRRGALLINTARGALVDLDAVVEALRNGQLGGAALDVLPQEPPPAVPAAPNLILTPHAAYYSRAAEQRVYALAVARVRELLGA